MTDLRSPGVGSWLARYLPYRLLVPVALILGGAPFRPEPHLTEKLRMLSAGGLTRPLDIFDLVLHGSPLVLVGARLVLDVVERRRRNR
ncbi:MAG: hypothetical protein OEO20_07070 [Gemmatimonadota bacterium]|nr:hypothetical protein [Gemmatimonadota bacterium]MDH3368212.1 hypothetical protein [Gemmatimonadota bacterium]MDH3478049.1 hypothetical protein [Gemmatimonadota bacterium]MDH5551008.1 hypothetical protein [Gemmatimonadota bacterium]